LNRNYNIISGNAKSQRFYKSLSSHRLPRYQQPTAVPAETEAATIVAVIDRYSRCFKNSPGERYLTEVRGIKIFDDLTGTTAGSLDKYRFGYAPNYCYNGDGRLIIPLDYPKITDPTFLTVAARRLVCNPSGYKARSIRHDCEARYKILLNKDGGHRTYPGNYCEELHATDYPPMPSIVIEGEIDSLSVKTADPDAKAVSIGNAGRVKGFVDDLLRLRSLGVPVRPLWLIPDNDKNGTGVKAMKELSALLDRFRFLNCWWGDDGAPYELDLLRGTSFKDVNEFLTKDKATLTKRLIAGQVVATDWVKLWKF